MLLRLALTGMLCLLPGLTAAQDIGDCGTSKYCVEDQFLRIDLNDMTVRDSIVNLDLTYTNPLDEIVVLTIYSIYLIATSANGERIELSTQRVHLLVGANARRSDAFSLKFNEPIGGEIDLIFRFENPDSRYAFLNVQPADFTEAEPAF